MNNFVRLIAATVALLALASCATVPGAGGSAVLTDDNGMTLYTFDKDPAEQSACNGTCAQKWPPYLVGGSDRSADGLSIIERDDGSEQWAINGKALYLWVGDAKPGDTTGDGVGGVWHIVSTGGGGTKKAY